jgi:hypothetical protein
MAKSYESAYSGDGKNRLWGDMAISLNRRVVFLKCHDF